MGVFNVSFLKPGAVKGGGSGYGVLVDQLAILENELAKDGNLSPGDYDLLTAKAREVASSPGLTADQRSNVKVKLSSYEKGKAVSKVSDSNDIGRLNREAEDDHRTQTLLFGNDPTTFVQGQVDLLSAKIERLTTSIDQLDDAGSDSSAYVNEQVGAMQQLQDLLDAQEAMRTYAPGSKPGSDVVAFIDTNAQGEITKVELGRTGTKSGYAETNAVYGGLPIYGRPNSSSQNKKVFKLGNVEYSGTGLQIADPDVPGSFRSAPLLSPDVAKGRPAGSPIFDFQYKSMDPASVRPQRAVRSGGFARGRDGTLYESLATGGYRKYVNTLPDQLGRGDADVLDVPQRMEAGFNGQSIETVYGADLPQMSAANPAQLNQLAPTAGPAGAPEPGADAPATPSQSTPAAPVSSRTPSPTERTPTGPIGYAAKAFGAAKRYLTG
jgi:hypothetical protein